MQYNVPCVKDISIQSTPELLEIALTKATEDNLRVALTPASKY